MQNNVLIVLHRLFGLFRDLYLYEYGSAIPKSAQATSDSSCPEQLSVEESLQLSMTVELLANAKR